ncbi:MAG: alkaline phosphatase family protein [Limisphaerales bacterium]
MNRLAVINVVGLTESLIGEHAPRIAEFRKHGALAQIMPAFPAVTCTAQSNYLTGKTPSEHGIVGNGWFNRELAEVQFWKQSNHIVQGQKIWDALRIRNPQFTTANCFWWFNMYSGVDYSITPRPDVSRRWPEIFRHLFVAVFHPRRNQRGLGRISVLRILGTRSGN